MAENESSLSTPTINFKVWATVLFATSIGIALVVFVCLGETKEEFYTTMIIGLAGLIVGWLIAFIVAPYDQADKTKLSDFAKLTGGFISGYVLSKTDKTVEKILNQDKLVGTIDGTRVLIFCCFFILSFIVVYVFRVYVKAT